MLYFTFKNHEDSLSSASRQDSFWQSFINRILEMLLPKANPDFNGLYHQVKTWYVEYDIEKQHTNREVGTDDDGHVIVKAPFGRNLGLWVDEELNDDDYKRLGATAISSIEFETLWSKKTDGDDV
ncbi:MAG: hypothetical protein IJK42_04000 [Prevotella sp.]|nr:hypothetical protein [Prevotella sp.]